MVTIVAGDAERCDRRGIRLLPHNGTLLRPAAGPRSSRYTTLYIYTKAWNPLHAQYTVDIE